MLLLVALYVLVCLVLSLVILLQRGRGGDIASAFGGSSNQAAFGALWRNAADESDDGGSGAVHAARIDAVDIGQRGGARSSAAPRLPLAPQVRRLLPSQLHRRLPAPLHHRRPQHHRRRSNHLPPDGLTVFAVI